MQTAGAAQALLNLISVLQSQCLGNRDALQQVNEADDDGV